MEQKKLQLVVLNHKTKEIDIWPLAHYSANIYAYIAELGYENGTFDFMVTDTPQVKVNQKANNTYGYIGTLTVNSQCGMVKAIEKEQLVAKMRKLGITRYVFVDADDRPVVAAYLGEHPGDFAVMSVSIDEKDNITLYGCDTECYGDKFDIEPNEVFEGHLEYVTNAIK